jgi:ATP-dependent exoDNAse (exonuclease V) alpha subunit
MNVKREPGIVLSADQKNAKEQFCKFLSDDNRVFILKGYAGTGKTTMAREMISLLEAEHKHFRLLASTGRAAKILANTTGMGTSTVHSMIYTFSDLNQDIEKISEERQRTGIEPSGQLYLIFECEQVEPDHEQCFYFVDEASMVSDVKDPNATQAVFGSGKLLTDLFYFDPKGKFIFIGDAGQLPPVQQKESPALSLSYIQNACGKKATEATLTQIMRQQQGNDIVNAAQKMRYLYQNPQPTKWAKFKMRGFKNVHLLSSQIQLVQMYIDRIKKYGYNDSTLICFSNRQCSEVTKLVRPALGLKSDTLQQGDLLMVTQNNLITGLMNGDLVEVTYVGSRERRASLTFVNVTVEEVITRKSYSTLMIGEILYSNQTNLTSQQQKNLFVDFGIRMNYQNITQKSLAFKKAMLYDKYLNALRAVYGFALTCHKSQGGEWDNVFLNIPRNLPIQPKPYVYQWMYTAMTRAKKELYLVDDFYIM